MRTEDFILAVEQALTSGDFSKISDEEIAEVLTAAIRIYAAKSEATETTPSPILVDKVTPTDVVVTVSEAVKAADLNLFDLSMWFRRAK